MPIFKNYIVFKPIKNITAFLTLNLGVIRSDTADPERMLAQAEREEKPRGRERRPQGSSTNEAARTRKIVAEQREQLKVQRENLKTAGARIADQKQQIDRWRNAAQEKDLRIALLEERLLTDRSGDPEEDSVHPGSIVWIFGTTQTGGTRLGAMIGELEGHEAWDEPKVGELFGRFYYEQTACGWDGKECVMGPERKGTWLRSIRNFVLDAVEARNPSLVEGGYLAIKESSGSIGAPLLVEALPESRVILLIRNPKDVVSSALEAAGEDGIAHEPPDDMTGQEQGIEEQPTSNSEQHQDTVVDGMARMYLQHVGNARRAYEEHAGPKTVVRHEELLADPSGTMRRLYTELDIALDEEKLAEVVGRHSGEQHLGREQHGSPYNGAVVRGTEANLTGEQEEIVEKITAPLREEFYPG